MTSLPPFPVLFLDIDGVLNTVEVQKASWKGYINTNPLDALMPEKVKLLNQLVGRVWFVLSSRWLGRFSLKEIQDFLTHQGFAGVLNDHTPRRMTSQKDSEILWYLQENPGVKGIVLDDDVINPKPNCLMIRTNEKYGLEQHHLNRILAFLGGTDTEGSVEEGMNLPFSTMMDLRDNTATFRFGEGGHNVYMSALREKCPKAFTVVSTSLRTEPKTVFTLLIDLHDEKAFRDAVTTLRG